jgi:transcription elongation factor Elf1
MIKDEALKLALEALEKALHHHGVMLMSNPPQDAWKYHRVEQTAHEAIAAIEEALAQPEQEPVALPCCGYADASAVKWNPHNQVVQCHNCGQVYETPPQQEQKLVGTVGDLFDDRVIAHRKLDRDLLVYTAAP